MAVMDEFKEERESLKGAPFRKKAEYFWMYYKWYVLGSIAVVLLLVTTISGILQTKDDIVTGVVINCKKNDALNDLCSGFLSEYGYNEKKQQAYFNCDLKMGRDNYSAMQQTEEYISAQMFSKSLDFCVMPAQYFHSYAYGCNFLDMEIYLDAEILDLFEGHIYYVDLPVAEEYAARLNDNKPVDDILMPDPAAPGEMKDPHPVGIDISAYPALMEAFGYEEGSVYIGIVKNTKHLDAIAQFLSFLSSYERN